MTTALPEWFPPPFAPGREPDAPHRPWTVVDLFSGAGGMSWGFAALPEHFRLVAAVDAQRGKPGRGASAGSSPRCNPTYAANHGVEPYTDDLATVDPAELRERIGLAPGELDVLAACAPCTGFSQKLAANHAADDARNGLVPRVATFAAAFGPRVVVMENVKELLAGRHRHHFQALRRGLGELGYSVSAGVHDLSVFGLPQLRKRALVIAVRGGEAVALEPAAAREPTTVREVIGGLPPLARGETHAHDSMHVCPRHTPAVVARIEATPRDGGSWADLTLTHPHLLIPSMVGKRPGSFPDVYGRLWWDEPARTITRECAHPGNGRYLHPEQDRMLSVREMALLQGFPPGYRFVGPLTARYNQIGDAVPPLVARLVAGRVADALAATPAARRLAA